ncbi:amino acid-binding protein [Actinophytocola xinjiangensis]|uniref:Amino acid-binding protein n=1 Tax=Actinophytocola xinjiangensis TaxID=485602 RepID=A0A7Z0WHI9_9PSEU|nr:ACT domain-containing protein [Actinophytocola xinjiangensis]OLF05472.1 amino acid-binding protein [Actinophytocola xinjiangensis]
MRRLGLVVAAGEYTVARLPAGATPPADLFPAGDQVLVSVVSAADGVTVVCPTRLAAGLDTEVRQAGWRLLSVRGPLDFTLTGIMAALAGELAAAGVSLFAVSTYDTDHVLVKAGDLDRAVAALVAAGHEVHGP